MGLKILLYWPNIIGYVRIGLLFAAWAAHETPAVFVALYSVFITLDGVDGWLARRLGQTSKFGAWLDVVVDNLGRGMLWSLLFKWGWLVSALEWCVFVCNHNSRGDHWKSSFNKSPGFIKSIMANGFRTPLGTWVVSGLHCLPLWLYGCHWGLLAHWLHLPPWIQALGTLMLSAGRLLALHGAYGHTLTTSPLMRSKKRKKTDSYSAELASTVCLPWNNADLNLLHLHEEWPYGIHVYLQSRKV